MHKSKLAGFVIDCKTDDLSSAAEFWAAALGMPSRQLSEEEADKYIELVDPNEQLHIEVQSVDHPSRVHLDIETDDIEAEVKRLEALVLFQHDNAWFSVPVMFCSKAQYEGNGMPFPRAATWLRNITGAPCGLACQCPWTTLCLLQRTCHSQRVTPCHKH